MVVPCTAPDSASPQNTMTRIHEMKFGNLRRNPCVNWALHLRSEFTISDSAAARYLTRREQREIPVDREAFTQEHLASMIELRPPDIMPQGNVGTPTRYCPNPRWVLGCARPDAHVSPSSFLGRACGRPYGVMYVSSSSLWRTPPPHPRGTRVRFGTT